MIHCCPKCGRIIDSDVEHKTCDICKTDMFHVPEEYTRSNVILRDKEKLYDDLVKTSPEFDPYLFEHRNEILSGKLNDYHRHMAITKETMKGADIKTAKKIVDAREQGKEYNAPKCPACGSLAVKRIGGAERAVSVGLFGLFSSKIGKTLKCNDCGYKW